MSITRTPIVYLADGRTPDVTQTPVNGWGMTFNPDDGRWYVHHPDDEAGCAHATFAERRNALQYARTHTP